MARQSEKTKAAPAPAPATVIYLGPNTRTGLAHGQVYRGGLPPAAVGVDPLLLVPLGDLPAAKLELADPRSALSKAYRAAERR